MKTRLDAKPWLLVALVACARESTTLPPTGQLLLYVDTDAPLPAAPGERLGPDDAPALFDRVRIDVYRAGESQPCAECTHEFDLDRTTIAEGRASVGIATPPHQPGYRARVRLFLSRYVEIGEPRADASLETWVALPATEDEGITPVTVVLHTDDVAKPIGSLDAPALPTPGPAQPIGAWPSAARVPCASPPRAGEVCIPGGAYWMGNPLLAPIALANGEQVVLRIAVLSPFYLDATETTVAAFRASRLAVDGDPGPHTDQASNGAAPLRCSWTPEPGDNEGLPLDCTSWAKARAFCQSRGMDLPSEAQLQYAASGLASHLYVWGDDEPSCDDAVFNRSAVVLPDVRCPGESVEPPGRGKRDRLSLPTGEVVDLAGNLTELARDRFNFQSEACWGKGVFHDPLCNTPSPRAPSGHTFVAGPFFGPAAALAAASRGTTQLLDSDAGIGLPHTNPFVGIGFRCSRPSER